MDHQALESALYELANFKPCNNTVKIVTVLQMWEIQGREKAVRWVVQNHTVQIHGKF